jgi:hypothetical protein
MALTAEQTQRIQILQAKVLAGTHTKDDLKEGIAILRQDRVGAQIASTKAKTANAEAKKVVNPATLLADLKALGAKLQSGPVA